MFSRNNPRAIFHLGVSAFVTGSRTGFALNSSYTHLTSGTAYALRFIAPVTGPLSKAYVLLDATTGTRGNITVEGLLYQNNSATSTVRPGSTLLAQSNAAALPATDDRWIEIVFPTPATVTQNQVYWLIFRNLATNPATDFPTILSTANFRISATVQDQGWFTGFQSTNGFSTNGTSLALSQGIVLIDNEPYGNPFTLSSTTGYATNQLRHGARFRNELKHFKIYSVGADSLSGPTSGQYIFEIQDATQPPGSGIQYQQIITPYTIPEAIFNRFHPATTLTGNNDFIASAISATNNSTPAIFRIEGYSDFPTMFDKFIDNMVFCQAVQEIGGAWVDLPGDVARFQICIDDLAIPTSGGLLLPRGMNGGFGD